jgi:hypothetical protein
MPAEKVSVAAFQRDRLRAVKAALTVTMIENRILRRSSDGHRKMK